MKVMSGWTANINPMSPYSGIIASVLSRIEKTVDYMLAHSAPSENGCRNWMGSKNPKGYGWVRANAKTELAHRWMAHLAFGFDIDSPLQVLHTCDNPACVNPDHLFIGTDLDNMMDKVRKGRHGRTKLTPSDVRAIRKEREEQKTPYYIIARNYGVTKRSVWQIFSGRTWTWVDG
jgi:hypothetical protein